MKQECTARLPFRRSRFWISRSGWSRWLYRDGFTEPVGKWWYFSKGEPARVRYRLDMITEKDGCLDEKKRECCEAEGWHLQPATKIFTIFSGRRIPVFRSFISIRNLLPCFKAIRKNSKRFFHRKVHHSASLRMAAF